MSTLHDRLVDLAEAAPSTSTAPPTELWARGVRYRRRRRGGTAVVLACALAALVALGAVTWQRHVPAVEPAGSHSAPALPDRFYAPSPWLPGTDDDGPLGRLAAVLSTERGTWTGGATALVGVSATTGEYRYLDLPDADPDTLGTAALAPDGVHVAYWYAGDTARVDNVVRGVAVYDTRTGAVERWRSDAPYGLSRTFPQLVWAGPDEVVFRADVNDDASGASGHVGSLQVWTVGASGPRSLVDGTGDLTRAEVYGSGPGWVLLEDHRVLDVVGTRTGVVEEVLDVPTEGRPVVLDRGSGTLATLGSTTPSAVRAGLVETQDVRGGSPRGRAALRTVPGSDQTYDVVGWVDAHHLATQVLSAVTGQLVSVDVGTGAAALLSRDLPAGTSLATDLLAAPTATGRRPPSPLDPRLVAGTGAAVVVIAGFVLVWWRRRVRP